MKQPETIVVAEYLESIDEKYAAKEIRRLHAIEEAAKNLAKVKGRYHTEQAFNQLKELLK